MNPMNTRDAHSTALHHLINDMRHTLNWIAAALIGATAYNAILAALDIAAHDYIAAAIRTVLAVAFGFWTRDTRRRARKYQEATR